MTPRRPWAAAACFAPWCAAIWAGCQGELHLSPRDDDTAADDDDTGDDDDTQAPCDPSAMGGAEAEVAIGPVVGGMQAGGAVVMVQMSAEGSVQLELSTDPDFATPTICSPIATAGESTAYTTHLVVDGLEPGTTYYYRVYSGGVYKPLTVPHSFTTAPSPDSTETVSFAVIADADSVSLPDTPTYRTMAAMDLDFLMQIGDLDHRNPADMEPLDVENWRQMYRDQLRLYEQGLQLDELLLSQLPFLHMWDDHDFGADNACGDASWKDVATQAFAEYFPLPPRMPNPDGGLWHAVRWGPVEVILLDLRTQRSPNLDEDVDGKSMLDGWSIADDQKDWLKDHLRTSDAPWHALVSGSVWNPHSKEEDSWFLYQTEQQELLSFFEDEGIEGVFVISGDIHSGGGIDDGTNSGVPEISVPCTNCRLDNCTMGICGEWSEGIQAGWDGDDPPAGFARITIEVDTVHRATLEIYGDEGEFRRSLVLERPL